MNAIATPEQVGLTAEQIAIRTTGVGASEVYDALFNPTQLWLHKTGREPRDDNALARLGNAIEPYILGEYALATNNEIVAKPPTLRSGRMIAHVDAFAYSWDESDIVVECKWRGHREGWGAENSADIPQKVMLQVQQQMGLANFRFAHVPVLFMRPPIVRYAVDFDAELFEMLKAGVDRFWWHVEHDVPPSVNPDTPEALEVLRKLYPGTDGTRMRATRELEHWRTVAQQSAEKAKSYGEVADTAKAHLLAAMGPAAELEFMDGMLFRRKVTKRKGYEVQPSEYIDCRFTKPRSTEHAE